MTSVSAAPDTSEITSGRFQLGADPPSYDNPMGQAGAIRKYTEASRFVVFDAATMDSTPIASVEVPCIPFGFHGSWVPSSVA